MKKRVSVNGTRICVDTDKDILAHRMTFEKDTRVFEAYFHRKKCFCYIYEYRDLNPDRVNEKITHKSKDDMNEWLEFSNSPSRIFTCQEDFDEYNKKSETEPVEIVVKN